MAKELIMKATTVEQAKAKIAAAFGVEEDRVTFEVLQQPQKKTLGLFGGADAEVRGTLAEKDPAEAAKAFLSRVLEKMGVVGATVTARVENETCVLAIEGEDLGFIIGRRGETLDALQYLTGLVANRVDNSYYRISIDIGNYREKREQTLEALAKRIGEKAAKTGRRTSLEPMNPYERRIIHTAVQEIEGATSFSVGSDAARHVVIAPSDDNPMKNNSRPRRRRGNGGNRANGASRRSEGERTVGAAPEHIERPVRRERTPRDADVVAPNRPVRQFVPRSNPLPMADGATPQKTESERENSASLYGRIDL